VHIIVPESEIQEYGFYPLKAIANSVLSALPVEYIQSYDELGEGDVFEGWNKEFTPSVEYFGFVAQDVCIDTNEYNICKMGNARFIEVKAKQVAH